MSVLSQEKTSTLASLPDRLNVRKTITRCRAKNLTKNPQAIADLLQIRDEFRCTTNGDDFMQYDSLENASFNLGGRLILFSTKSNLEYLMRSDMWFVDGIFKTAPNIFFQFFAVLGSVKQTWNGEDHYLALPYVYVLLESKEQVKKFL